MNDTSGTHNQSFSNKLGQITSMFLIIGGLVLLCFFFEGRYGLDLSDEGFLWYGSQRVLEGEVPLRDFASYDIGRYYWTAAFMKLLGSNGLLSLRAAAMLFQALALWIIFFILINTSSKQNILYWLIALTSLMLWMLPPYRLYDISLPIILTGVLAWLIQQPSRFRYFLTGLTVGLAAVFGRNHGLYGALASVIAILFLHTKSGKTTHFIESLLFWSLGVLLGYSPVLAFLAFVPGFAEAFLDSIKFLLFEIKMTNQPLPVPWPWLLPAGKTSLFLAVRYILRGSFFVAILLFGIIGTVWLVREKLRRRSPSPVFASAVFLTFPYAHYAFSRADMLHLMPAMPPFIIGSISLLSRCSAKAKWLFALVLCVACIFLMLPLHPRISCHFSETCTTMIVAGENLTVDLKTAEKLTILKKISARLLPPNRTLLIAPFSPGAYAMLGRKSPMWDIYALFPRNDAFQQREIERIKMANPYLALIDNSCLDGNNSLCFRKTHPLIYQFINDNFILLNDSTANLSIYMNKR
ncbi:MAG TPA: hypothetical protein PLT45_09515 [Smithella sp.]|nr:hypothetical protein [Smithella sp.]